MKSGIDYFPLDVHLDSKMQLIEAEFGLSGFAAIVKLWQRIYAEAGYYAEWTDEVSLLFGKKTGLSGAELDRIVNAAVKRGIFDKGLFKGYGVLTSRGIQKRYFEAASRRKQLNVRRELLLVDAAAICKNVVIYDENGDILQQSRVEQSREEQSRVEQSREEQSSGKEEEITGIAKEANADCARYYLSAVNPRASKGLLDKLRGFVSNGMHDETIICIIDYCLDEDKKSWSYIYRVIGNLFNEGVRTPGDYQASRKNFFERTCSPSDKHSERKQKYYDVENKYFEDLIKEAECDA